MDKKVHPLQKMERQNMKGQKTKGQNTHDKT